MASPQPPHDRGEACSTCFNFRHDAWHDFPQSSGSYIVRPPLPVDSEPQYMQMKPSRLAKTARSGCKYCSIIYLGLQKGFANTNADRLFDDTQTWQDDGRSFFGVHVLTVQNTPGKPLSVHYEHLAIEFRPSASLKHESQEDFIASMASQLQCTPKQLDHVTHHFCVEVSFEFHTRCPEPDRLINKHLASPSPSISKRSAETFRFASAPAVPTKLSVERCAHFTRRWIQDCDTAHPHCTAQKAAARPKRLLDICGTVRLIDSSPGTTHLKYITLSHCWGDTSMSSRLPGTRRSNTPANMKDIAWDTLPTLIQDVILVVRALDVAYLWIDAFCIIQDDDQDWMEHTIAMAGIYSGAYLNIATTAHKNSESTMFGSRHAHSFEWERPVPISLDEETPEVRVGDLNGVDVYMRASRYRDHNSILLDRLPELWQNVPLLSRAWVLQERLLARRVLHFTGSELIWECGAGYACECGGLAIAKDTSHDLDVKALIETSAHEAGRAQLPIKMIYAALLHGIPNKQASYDLWLRIVQQYSSLSLTNVSDRACALAGIAQEFQALTGDAYLAGIWTADILRSLLWSAITFNKKAGHVSKMLEVVRTIRNPPSDKPTWSWMSWVDQLGCGVLYWSVITRGFIQDTRACVEQSDTRCRNAEDNPYTTVTSGRLVLTGVLMPPEFSSQYGEGFRNFLAGWTRDRTEQYFINVWPVPGMPDTFRWGGFRTRTTVSEAKLRLLPVETFVVI